MILIVSLLPLIAAALFVAWITMKRRSAARARIERELIRRTVEDLREEGAFDESLLLRDEAHSALKPLNRLLESIRFTTKIKTLLVQADVDLKVGSVVLMMAVLGLIGLIAGRVFLMGIGPGILTGALLGASPLIYLHVRRRRRRAAFEAQFPEAVDMMSRAIRAGHAFTTGIKMVGDEMPDPVGKEFRRVFAEQDLGLPIRSAMMRMLDRVDLVDLKLFVVAVLIQRQSGGNLAEILDKIAYTIRERFRIFRQLKVHTAQAKLTGIILTALPPVVASLIFMLNYEYIKIIFTEPAGLRILAASAALQIVGFLWIRKIVNIEV